MAHITTNILQLLTGPTRARSLLQRLVFGVGLLLILPTYGENVMQVTAISFANSPVLSNSTLYASYTDGEAKVWSLTLEAQFSNECLAAAGATARYIDKHSSGRENGLRIIIVQQNISSDGCPDIYQPQIKKHRIDMPADITINQILLMNYFETYGGWKRKYQVALLDIDQASTAKAATIYQPLPLRPIAPNATLPTIKNLTITAANGNSTSIPRYTLAFDAQLHNSCDANGEIDVHLIESRSVQVTQDQNTFYDWLLVLQRPGAARCFNRPRAATQHFSMQRSFHPHYMRNLLILNPILPNTNIQEKPFIDISINSIGGASQPQIGPR